MRVKKICSYILIASMLFSNSICANAQSMDEESFLEALSTDDILECEDVDADSAVEGEITKADEVVIARETVTDPDVPYSEDDNVIIYVLNNGINHPDNKTIYYPGSAVKLKKPTREGYKFGGWFDSEAFSKKAKITKTTKGLVRVYAKWIPRKFPIKYVLKQSGTGKVNNKINPKKYQVSETVDLELKNPTRKGYLFDGWYKDNTFTVSVNAISRNTVGKAIVYAKWHPTVYKIKFDLNGVSANVVGALNSYTYDEVYKFPTVTNSGKVFVGWKTTQSGKGKTYKAGAKLRNIVADGGEKTLYAVYKKGNAKASEDDKNLDASGYEEEVLRLVNEERAKEGLDPLKMDSGLLDAAHIRSKEIKQYFSHTRPDGTICFTAIANSNAYSPKGENIAMGQGSPKKVMESWMNSDGHRKNILTPEYNCIGVGCYKDSEGVLYWVQMFGRRD